MGRCSAVHDHEIQSWRYYSDSKIIESLAVPSSCLAIAENLTQIVLEPCRRELPRMKWSLENFDEKLFSKIICPCEIELDRKYDQIR